MSSFVETYDPTIEDCYRKQWVVDDQPCLLEVLDTAGQEEYTALRDQWIRDGEGFLVVYSICSRSTFDRVERIVQRILRVKDETLNPTQFSNPQRSVRVPVVIVGNKRDQFAFREVSTEEGQRLAMRLGCDFYEASARTNANVEPAFKSCVRGIIQGRRGSDGSSGMRRRKKDRPCVIL
ncbi:Ras family, other [Tremella mesenterica]|uniref:Ras family, other n=1 Tax=Tremella mesenterica TaxID=5217 RepID=A0A4Q1BSQ6_TREME|nr:Ras family, other [Tremella mesenterica]